MDSTADLELPLLTQHDVECIKTFSKVPQGFFGCQGLFLSCVDPFLGFSEAELQSS